MPMYSIGIVRQWESRMREVARALLDELAPSGEAEFVEDFGRRYFPYIGAAWIGVPEEARPHVAHMVHEVFQVKQAADRMIDMSNQAMIDVIDYCRALIELRREEPAPGTFTTFCIDVEVKGTPLSDDEVLACVAQAMLGSGHTLTTHLTYVWRHLADHPDLRHALTADPVLAETGFEELLRWYSLYGMPRRVTRDGEFHGCPLHKGDPVFALYTMANRDPRCPGYDRIDPTRKPNQHLGWQVGPHQCLGMHWARGGRRIAFQEWHARIPDYSVKPGVELDDQIYSGVGFRELPLVWDPASVRSPA
jgi:cytochrome P450